MTHGFENAVEGLNDLLLKNPELEVPVTTVIFSLCGLVSAYAGLKDRLIPHEPTVDPFATLKIAGPDMSLNDKVDLSKYKTDTSTADYERKSNT